MAAITISKSIPQCSECLRAYAFGTRLEYKAALGSLEHVRGKKSRKGPATVPVRLCQDLKGFGPKGALVPVPMGRMRNSFFPRGIASYVSATELRTLRADKVIIERDSLFGVEMQQPINDVLLDESIFQEEVKEPEQKPKQVVVKKTTPERELELFKIFVPKTLLFYREPIPITLSQRSTRASRAGEDLLQSREEELFEAHKKEQKDKQAIYGSVSTHDIYTAMKAALDTNDEASKIPFAEENVSIVKEGTDAADEAGKIKHTGTFVAEIKLRDGDAAMRRTVRVVAQRS